MKTKWSKVRAGQKITCPKTGEVEKVFSTNRVTKTHIVVRTHGGHDHIVRASAEIEVTS